MARRKIPRAEEPKPYLMRWLLTYADMITLLMLFFIILYSLSSINQAKFTEMAQAFNSVFNGGNFTIFDARTAGGAGVLQGVVAGQKLGAASWNKRNSIANDVCDQRIGGQFNVAQFLSDNRKFVF